jgi:RNA polymerase-binding transcription factor DksA
MPRTDLDLDKFRTLLEEEREKAVADAEQAGAIFDENEADDTGELTTYDDHQADIASDLTDRGQQATLRDNIRIVVELIDRALEKMDEGTYGLCDLCSKEIDIERLEFEPYAVHCLEDQKRIEGTE